MTPEQRLARQQADIDTKLTRALLFDEFPNADRLDTDQLFKAVPDKLKFERNAAAAAWMERISSKPVMPGSADWQPAKDALARSFFRQKDAQGVSDDELHTLIRSHLQTAEAVQDAAFSAAANGKPILRAMETMQAIPGLAGPSKLRSKFGDYQEAFFSRYDEAASRLAPYRGVMAELKALGENASEQQEGLPVGETNVSPWEQMARLMLEVPAEDRALVINATAAMAEPDKNKARDIVSRLAMGLDSGLEFLLTTGVEGLRDLDFLGFRAAGEQARATITGEPVRPLQTDEEQELQQLRNQMRDLSRSALDKNPDVRALGMNLTGAMESVPMTLTALIPYAGPALLLGSFKSSTEYELRQKYPEMTNEQVERISTIAAPFQAATETISDRLMFGRLPNLKRLLNAPAFSVGGIAGQFAARVGIAAPTEYAEEFFQAALPEVITALSEDVPDVNWNEFFRDWKANQGELVATIMPLVLLGAGVGQFQDFKTARGLAKDPQALLAAGYTEEAANKITEAANAGNWTQAQDLMLSDWRKVNATGAPIAEVAAEAFTKKASAAREELSQRIATVREQADTLTARAGYSLRRVAGGWEVATPDGVMTATDSESAIRLLERHFDSTELQNIRAIAQLAESFGQQGVEAEDVLITPGVERVQELYDAIEVSGKMAGMTDEEIRKATFTVLGSNKIEIIDGIKRSVSTINEGGNVLTMVEETVEGRLKRAIMDNVYSREEITGFIELAESVTGENFLIRDAQNADRALIEAVSKIVVSDVLGRRKEGKLPAGAITQGLKSILMQTGNVEAGKFATFLKAFRARLGAVFKIARRLQVARREGKLTQDFDTFVESLLGVRGEIVNQQATVEAAQQMAQEAAQVLGVEETNALSARIFLEEKYRVYEKKPGQTYASPVDKVRASLAELTNSPILHETDLAGARRLLAMLMGRNGRARLFVTNDPDLALGQGGKGVRITLNPDRVNGFAPESLQNKNLAAIGSTSREFLVEKFTKGAVQKIEGTRKNLEKLQKDIPLLSKFQMSEDGLSLIRSTIEVTTEQATETPAGETFSTVPNFQQRLSSVFSPLMRDPKMRREVAKFALERATKQVRAIANPQTGKAEQEATERLQERLLSLEADLRADIAAIEQERDFELAGAKEDKAGKLAEEKIKRAADKKIAARRKEADVAKAKLESDFAATAAGVDRQARMLAAMRTLDAALSAMPPQVRAKVGGFIAVAQRTTAEGMMREIERRIAKMDTELEKFIKKEITREVEKNLEKYRSQKSTRGKIEGKLLSTATEQIDYAAGIYDATPEEQQQAMDSLERLIETSDDADAVQDAMNKLAIARMFSGWKEQDSEAASVANDWLGETVEAGRLGKRLLDEERKQMLDGLRKAAREDILQGAEASLVEAENKDNRTDSNVWRKAVRQLRGAVDSLLWTTAQQLEIVFGEDSQITRFFTDRVIEAANLSVDIKRNVDAQRTAFLKRLYGTNSDILLSREIAKIQKVRKSGVMQTQGRKTETVRIPVETLEKLADGKVKSADIGLTQAQVDDALERFAQAGDRAQGIEVEKVLDGGRLIDREMSEAQGIQWLLWWRQEASRKQMERDGWTEQSMAELDAFLSPQAKAIAEYIAESYNEAAQLIDPVYRRAFNAPLPRIKNYAPIYRVRSGDTNVANVDPQQQSSGLAAGFTMARVNTTSPLAQVDALVTHLSHWEHVSHWVANAELVRDMKAVLLDRETTTAIRTKASKALVDNLKNRVSALENMGNRSAWDLHALNGFWSNLVRFRAFKALAFRISPIVKQTGAFLNPLMADVPAPAFMAGLARAFGKPVEFYENVAAIWKSDTIRRRIESGFSPEARIAMQGAGVNSSLIIAAMQRGMLPMGLTDAGWNTMGAAIAFDYYKRRAFRENEGMTDEIATAQAIKAVERMLSVAAQPSEMAYRSLIENTTNPFVKSMWMFASEPRKNLAVEIMAIRRLLTGKSKNKALDLQRVFVAHVLNASITQLMAGFLASLLGDEEDKEREWSAEQWQASILAGPIAGLFVAGRLIEAGIKRAFDLRVFQDKNLLEGTVSEVYRAGNNIADLFSDDGDAMLDEIDRLTSATSSVFAALLGPQAGAVDVFLNAARDARKAYEAAQEE
jgi:hypothetical protein